jgi:hypothetical protein
MFRICPDSFTEAFRYQGIMCNFNLSDICILGGNTVRLYYLAVCGSLHTSMTEVTRLCYHGSVTVSSSIFCSFSVFCSFFQSVFVIISPLSIVVANVTHFNFSSVGSSVNGQLPSSYCQAVSLKLRLRDTFCLKLV